MLKSNVEITVTLCFGRIIDSIFNLWKFTEKKQKWIPLALDPEPRKGKDGRRGGSRADRGNWREDARVERERRETREREMKERREQREHQQVDTRSSPQQNKGKQEDVCMN